MILPTESLQRPKEAFSRLCPGGPGGISSASENQSVLASISLILGYTKNHWRACLRLVLRLSSSQLLMDSRPSL